MEMAAVTALWVQGSEAGEAARTNHLILILIVLVSVVVVAQAVVQMVIAVKAHGAIKEIAAGLETIKAKALPLLDSSVETVAAGRAMIATARAVIVETAPKVRTISDHLVETTGIVNGTAKSLGATVQDANVRTHRQIARVDGMVTAALITTGEVAETIAQNIRVPAQRIAVAATQAKNLLDALLSRARSAGLGGKTGQTGR